MSGVDERTRLWSDILDRLPVGWRCSQPSYDPGRGLWEAVAIGPTPGGRRSPPPEYVIGTGPDELAALADRPSGSTAGPQLSS